MCILCFVISYTKNKIFVMLKVFFKLLIILFDIFFGAFGVFIFFRVFRNHPRQLTTVYSIQ